MYKIKLSLIVIIKKIKLLSKTDYLKLLPAEWFSVPASSNNKFENRDYDKLFLKTFSLKNERADILSQIT